MELEQQLAQETARRPHSNRIWPTRKPRTRTRTSDTQRSWRRPASHVAGVQAEYDAAVAEADRTREVFEQQLSEAAAALEGARQARASEAAAAADHLRQREAELGATLAEAMTARSALEQTLAAVEAAHQQAEQRVAGELAAAAERHVELEQQLTQESARRTTLEQNLAYAQTAQQDANERHRTELAAAAAAIVADVQAEYDAAVAHAAADARSLRTAAGRGRCRYSKAPGRREASEAARRPTTSLEREAELGDAHWRQPRRPGPRSNRRSPTSRRRTSRPNSASRANSPSPPRGRRRSGGTNLQQEAPRAHPRGRSCRDTRWSLLMPGAASSRSLLAIRRRSREHRDGSRRSSPANGPSATSGFVADGREPTRNQRSLRQRSSRVRTRILRLTGRATEEHETYEHARSASESEIRRLSAEYDQVREALDQVRASFHTLELVSSEHGLRVRQARTRCRRTRCATERAGGKPPRDRAGGRNGSRAGPGEAPPGARSQQPRQSRSSSTS